MPVKVRCPECEKMLTLPDQAAGKSAKCTHCDARVSVPRKKKAGPPRKKSAPKRTGRTRAPQDEEEALAELDLSRAEDMRIRVCPKCGVEVDEEDVECPSCHVELHTGRLSAERQRKKKRGGPDTDLYFEKFLNTGWGFLKEHWMFGLRTTIYMVVISGIYMYCMFMVLFVSKVPLKFYWLIKALVVFLLAPGWCWFLHTKLVDATLNKGVKLDKVRFDFFTNVALGIKFYVWMIVFCAPFQLIFGTIGYLLIRELYFDTGLFVIMIGFLPGFFCFPVVMSHMSMPIQWPGWLSPKIIPMYFKGMVGPSMYWCMFCSLAMLPSLIFFVLSFSPISPFRKDVIKFMHSVNHNAVMGNIMALPDEEKKPGEENSPDVLGSLSEPDLYAPIWWFTATENSKRAAKEFWKKKNGGTTNIPEAGAEAAKKPVWEVEVPSESIIGPVILWILGCIPFGFAAVFAMRTAAHFTYYYRPELELITEEKAIVFKRKMRHKDDPEEEDDW